MQNSDEFRATINWQDGWLRLYSDSRVDADQYKALREQGFSNRRGETIFKAAYTPYRAQFLVETFQVAGLEDDDVDINDEAQERGERYERRADRNAGESAQRWSTATKLADMIPMGQPILVGHHSEKRHRAHIAKIETNMAKGWEAHKKAEYWERRAASAIRRAEQRMTTPAIYRRIETLEADLRKFQRYAAEEAAAGRKPSVYTTGWLWFTENRIAFERALIAHLGDAGKTAERDQFEKDGAFKFRGRWHIITRVNPKTLSYTTHNCDLKIPYTNIAPGDVLTRQQIRDLADAGRIKVRAGGSFEVEDAPEPAPQPPVAESGTIEAVEEVTMQRIYTFGYLGTPVKQLEAAIRREDALLVDIRMTPFSRNPDYSAGRLRTVFGERYRQVRELGNVNYKNGGPIQLQAPDSGLEIVTQLAEQRPVVLMCGCRDFHTCHRKVVSDQLRERFGIETSELPLPSGEIPQVELPDPSGEIVQRGLFGAADDVVVNPPIKQPKLF
mgnify:CR=1 FL=1